MYQILKQNGTKLKYVLSYVLVITSLLLVTVVYKNDSEIKDVATEGVFKEKDLVSLKEFFFNKLKSPFISVEYEIKSGDTIQKILKKFKIRNNEINSVIKKYKNYGNANQLAVGNKINIIVEKDVSGEKNSL